MEEPAKKILVEFDSVLDYFSGDADDNITFDSGEPTIYKSNAVTKISDDLVEVEVAADEYTKGASKKLTAKDIVIYLVIDRPVQGLINYFRECGVLISNIYNSIVDARNTILIQSKPCRIIVVDTGLGKFTTTKTRQELIDMIGICDENNKVTVFYTDSVLKIDSMYELGDVKLDIDWHKYEGTASTVATILQYGEKYTLDERATIANNQESEEDIRGFKGLNSRLTMGEGILVTGLSAEYLIKNMLESNDGILPKFEIIM